MMRAACAREERAHTQQRSHVAATGRNTLKRQYSKVEEAAMPSLGGELKTEFVKKMCVAASEMDRGSALWRA